MSVAQLTTQSGQSLNVTSEKSDGRKHWLDTWSMVTFGSRARARCTLMTFPVRIRRGFEIAIERLARGILSSTIIEPFLKWRQNLTRSYPWALFNLQIQ
jgi:hypothetical protein